VQLKKVLEGSGSNMIRVILTALVGFVLPPFLVRHMSPVEYSAWVLILQLSAYVSLLDLGLQTAIAKFLAEYDSTDDWAACSRVLSSSFRILSAAAVAGMGLILVLTWQVPRIFQQMPPRMIGEVRASLLLIGLSVALGLPFNAFLASFIGLQRYGFPTVLMTISKVASSGTLVGLLLMHATLLQLSLVMAAFNLATAVFQYLGWRRFGKQRVGFSLRLFDTAFAIRIGKYCSALSIWTVAGLLISGLDTIIVGHYDFRDTGYYAIATNVTNFMMLVVGSLFGPLIPAVSSIQTFGNSKQIGDVAISSTRYCALMLWIIGLPILFGSYPLLSLWVGRDYALQSAPYLQVLVLGNVIRQFGYPYALVVVATGKQHLATIAGIAEALVNVALSVWLVQRIGAIGVAIGTFAGAFVSIGLHLTVSMHYTRPTILIQRPRFIVEGLLRPLVCIGPSLILLLFWKRSAALPAPPTSLAIWAVATMGLAWGIGLAQSERRKLWGTFCRLVYFSNARA